MRLRSFGGLFFVTLILVSCGKSGTSTAAREPTLEREDPGRELAGTSWTKKVGGQCGYGLSFEKDTSVFHYFYVCRSGPNQRVAMASYGTYEKNGLLIKAVRVGMTCPALEAEREIEIKLAGEEITVKSASSTMTLTRKVASDTPVSDDQVTYGCIDSDGSFTPHAWM